MGLLEVLTVIFVILKLVGVISWSWWVVLIPLYLSVILNSVIVTLMIKEVLKDKREMEEADKEFESIIRERMNERARKVRSNGENQ